MDLRFSGASWCNFDLSNVVTPVKADRFEFLLKKSNFDPVETKFLIDGFRNGFSLQFEGDRKKRLISPNLPFTVGNKEEMWEKIMQEVKLKRYAGPFTRPPFEFYRQSPIGLVPKDGGLRTRLIFHLSYPRNDSKMSVNSGTPRKYCVVRYKDFNDAVQLCLEKLKSGRCLMGKSDQIAAFRNLGIRPDDFPLLVFKAVNPANGKIYFFVDKCLPFGHAISCALFQRVSDAIAHVCAYLSGKTLINYLDDYFFADTSTFACNQQVSKFRWVCDEIAFPVSDEKTFWATELLAFLGLLIDTANQLISIPVDKIHRAKLQLISMLERKSKKVTLLELQRLAGFLNFLCRAVVPGRAFTRRIYFACKNLKNPFHHTRITAELRKDFELWLQFLDHPTVYCRPLVDFSVGLRADAIDLYTDASGVIGAGGICQNSWFSCKWDTKFIENQKPSIEFLELYAVAVAVLSWISRFKNSRVVLFCDNISVVYMINRSTSSCKNCLKLVRLIVMEGLVNNTRVFANYINTKQNDLADALSRRQFGRFRRLAKGRFNEPRTPIPSVLWPVSRIWQKT